MEKLKSFIYLDTTKMYSIASQIFEGFTQEILRNKSIEYTKETEQEGLEDSGRIFVDVLQQSKNYTEKKFLYDYSYNLLEKELFKRGSILSIDKENIDLQNIDNYGFVKISGNALLKDINAIKEILLNINDFTVFQQEQKNNNLKNKNTKPHKILDQKIINSLEMLLEYGYKDLLEMEINLGTAQFVAPLDREFLREKTFSITRKHTRNTEKVFTIMGIVTYSKERNYNMGNVDLPNNATQNIEGVINNLYSVIHQIENLFFANQNSFVIDPIAIYWEL